MFFGEPKVWKQMPNFFKRVGTIVVFVYCLIHEIDSFVFNTWYMDAWMPGGGIYIGNYTQSLTNCLGSSVGDGVTWQSGPNIGAYCYYDYTVPGLRSLTSLRAEFTWFYDNEFEISYKYDTWTQFSVLFNDTDDGSLSARSFNLESPIVAGASIITIRFKIITYGNGDSTFFRRLDLFATTAAPTYNPTVTPTSSAPTTAIPTVSTTAPTEYPTTAPTLFSDEEVKESSTTAMSILGLNEGDGEDEWSLFGLSKVMVMIISANIMICICFIIGFIIFARKYMIEKVRDIET